MVVIAFYNIFTVATNNKGYGPTGFDGILVCEFCRMQSSQRSYIWILLNISVYLHFLLIFFVFDYLYFFSNLPPLLLSFRFSLLIFPSVILSPFPPL
jgi:hypothetical protein